MFPGVLNGLLPELVGGLKTGLVGLVFIVGPVKVGTETGFCKVGIIGFGTNGFDPWVCCPVVIVGFAPAAVTSFITVFPGFAGINWLFWFSDETNILKWFNL